MNNRPYFLAIPEHLAKRTDLTPAMKLVAGSVYTRTYARNIPPGTFVVLKAGWIVTELGMSADTVTEALKRLESDGIIEIRRTMHGNTVSWKSFGPIPEIPESESRKNRNPCPEIPESVPGNSGIRIPENPECSSLIPDPIPDPIPKPRPARAAAGGRPPADHLEPFESGLVPAVLPQQLPTLSARLTGIAMRVGTGAERWAKNKVGGNVGSDDPRIEEVLRIVANRAMAKPPTAATYYDAIFDSLPADTRRPEPEPSPAETRKRATAKVRELFLAAAAEEQAKREAKENGPLSGVLSGQFPVPGSII